MKLVISIVLLICFTSSYSQKTEINAKIYSGFFSYYGNGSASKTSAALYQPTTPANRIDRPFGRHSEFSYSVGGNIQKITKSNLILGSNLSFETLKSSLKIDSVVTGDFIYDKEAANGKCYLKNSFITLSPFGGRRYFAGKYIIDFTAGADIAYCIRSFQSIFIDSKLVFNDPKDFRSFTQKSKFDFRPRLNIDLNRKRISLSAGYSIGIINYPYQNNQKAFSKYLRLGIGYRIN